MRELSESETEAVGAAFGVPGSIFGAGVGGVTYLGSSITSGNFSLKGLGFSIGVGAGLGFIGGPITSAARGYLMPRAAFAGGMGQGAIDGS